MSWGPGYWRTFRCGASRSSKPCSWRRSSIRRRTVSQGIRRSGEAYDETAAHLAGPLRGADGFIAHAATADADGVTVTELWEAEGDWSRFFETHVKPNVPATLPPPTVVEMRNTILR